MAQTTALRCRGDASRPGCGEVIGLVDHGRVYAVRTADLISIDQDGRSVLRCLLCGAVTTTRGLAKAG